MANLDSVVTQWLTLEEVATQLEVSVSKVRRMLQERALIASKRGKPKAFMVPAEFLLEAQAVPALKGTAITLEDAGLSPEESIEWLCTSDDTLPGRPIDLLRANNKAEVRRRAQALAF